MSLMRYLLGIPICAIAFAPIGLAARRVRRRLVPDARGADARLVEIVCAISAVVIVAEALGTVGWFSAFPVALGLAMTGTGVIVACRRSEKTTAAAPRLESNEKTAARESRVERRTDRFHAGVAVVAVFLVVVAWTARTVQSVQRGMVTVDTLWYHLPVAVRFVQLSRVTSVHYLDQDPNTAFFPANSSLLHAIGMLFFGTDLVSTVANLGWLALALVAAWCVGRAFGVAPAATIGVALLLGTPGLVATQPGGAYDDIAGIALLLAALAIVLRASPGTRPLGRDCVAAAAAGLALGMKFTFVAPAVALCIGLAFTTQKGVRARRAGLLLVCGAATGGFWYVRNAVLTGNPLPSLSLSIGPVSLPSVKGTLKTSTVSAFLFDRRAWTQNFLPGLRSSLGPVWPAILLFMFAGCIGALLHRDDSRVRVLGFVGLVTAVAYLVTPQYLLGGFGRPFFFAANLRYSSPALAIGLVLLPLVAGVPWRALVFWVYALALGATQIDPTSWPTGVHWAVFQDRVRASETERALVLVIVGLLVSSAACVFWRRVPRVHAYGWLAAIALPLVVVAGLASVHNEYLAHRYTDTSPYEKVYAWARQIRHERIAVVGLYLQGQYPLAGLDLSNRVQYAGIEVTGGGFRPVRSCAEWIGFLQRGSFDYVVIGPSKNYEAWTSAQPHAKVVLADNFNGVGPVVVRVFHLQPDRLARSC